MTSPVIIPATARHTATVFFFHGLGDTGHGWAAAFKDIRMAHVRYVCPTAPEMPVTINMGMRMPSWFDLRTLDKSSSSVDVEGIKRARTNVHKLIDDEIQLGIPSSRIVVGGFSQGGGLALYSGLTYAKPLAGIVALSTWLPGGPLRSEFPAALTANKNIAILQCHGEEDDLIRPQVAKDSADYMKNFCPNHQWKLYPDFGHSSSEEEMEDVKKFIQTIIPPEESKI